MRALLPVGLGLRYPMATSGLDKVNTGCTVWSIAQAAARRSNNSERQYPNSPDSPVRRDTISSRKSPPRGATIESAVRRKRDTEMKQPPTLWWAVALQLTIAIASGVDGADRLASGKPGWAAVYWTVSVFAVGFAILIALDIRGRLTTGERK